ncbi:CDP-glycerol glycerophosphotransferase family protein [Periweissella cryptocerci]|nr:CDP-glycerol glycerophosphotransferase family protein [Periweissella cryptocerci]
MAKLATVIIDNQNDGDVAKTLASLKKQGLFFSYDYVLTNGSLEERNNAITSATTKYLLFLQAGDEVLAKTLKTLLNDSTWDKTKVMQLSAFTIDDNGTNVLTEQREKLYKRIANNDEKFTQETDVYVFTSELRTFYVPELRSVIVENDGYLFDGSIKYQAVDDYFAHYIAKSKSIGLAFKAGVMENGPAIASSYLSELGGIDGLVPYFDKLKANYTRKNGSLMRYAQQLLVKQVADRFVNSYLIDQSLTGVMLEESKNKLANYLDLVDEKSIMRFPGVDRLHKYELIGMQSTPVTYLYEEDGIVFEHDLTRIGKEKGFETTITDIVLRDGLLSFSGYARLPYQERFDLKVQLLLNDEVIDLRLYHSGFGNFHSRNETNYFNGFDYSLKLANLNDTELKIRYLINGHEYLSTEFIYVNNRVWSDPLNVQTVAYEGLSFTKTKNAIKVEQVSDEEAAKLDDAKMKALETTHPDLIEAVVNASQMNTEVWLYSDDLNVTDNGFIQFQHDINVDDGVSRYYVYTPDTVQAEQVANIDEDKLVVRGSAAHKALYVHAKYEFTSFTDYNRFSPFDRLEYGMLGSMIQTKIIYFGHGVLHAHFTRLYSREKTIFDYVVASSEFEKQNLIDNYHYDETQVVLLGAPRFDSQLAENVTKSNHILYGPTWRAKLSSGYVDGKWQLNDAYLRESEFYAGVMALLNSAKLAIFLESNDMYLDVKLHPNFRDYEKNFKLSSDRIKFVRVNGQPASYAAYITDYSSFVFDFVYGQVPIFYYLMDENEFANGNHTYNRLDLPLEDGFGPISHSADELIDTLEQFQQHGVSELYQQREATFFNVPTNNREALRKYFIN